MSPSGPRSLIAARANAPGRITSVKVRPRSVIRVGELYGMNPRRVFPVPAEISPGKLRGSGRAGSLVGTSAADGVQGVAGGGDAGESQELIAARGRREILAGAGPHLVSSIRRRSPPTRRRTGSPCRRSGVGRRYGDDAGRGRGASRRSRRRAFAIQGPSVEMTWSRFNVSRLPHVARPSLCNFTGETLKNRATSSTTRSRSCAEL